MRMQNRQYTIRNIPLKLDQHLREVAKNTHKSLNEVSLDVLHRGSGLDAEPTVYNDLDFLVGSWQEDKAFDEALKLQNRIDPSLWK